ncbi:hypothetical protein ACEZCY_14605 [Streptacidiphilus sp. N1-12]|uniref:Uncharacterized protein n=2 Tax=Streptacidiphilus alkalitolerans TaxID=3342712 RepID=A0ABV6WFB0_9ACTN
MEFDDTGDERQIGPDEPGEPACLVHSSSLCGDGPECQPALTGGFSDEPPFDPSPSRPDPRLDTEPRWL